MSAPGFYPDPTGKPGQMYWDGQQWVPPAGLPQNPDLAAVRRRWASLRTRTKIAAVAAVIAIPVFTVWVFLGIADSVFRSSDPRSASSGHDPFPGGNHATCNPAWTCSGGSSTPQPPAVHAPPSGKSDSYNAGYKDGSKGVLIGYSDNRTACTAKWREAIGNQVHPWDADDYIEGCMQALQDNPTFVNPFPTYPDKCTPGPADPMCIEKP